jgi:hypothetical protein
MATSEPTRKRARSSMREAGRALAPIRSTIPTRSKDSEIIKASWLAETYRADVIGNIANAAIAHRVRRAKKIADALMNNAVVPFAARERYSALMIGIFAN